MVNLSVLRPDKVSVTIKSSKLEVVSWFLSIMVVIVDVELDFPSLHQFWLVEVNMFKWNRLASILSSHYVVIKFDSALLAFLVAVANPVDSICAHALCPEIEIRACLPFEHNIDGHVYFASNFFQSLNPFFSCS